MTTDIQLAFAHPEERAVASASADPRDRISLRDHIVEADIGAFQQERGRTQRLRFNVVVEVRPQPQQQKRSRNHSKLPCRYSWCPVPVSDRPRSSLFAAQ